jgi:ketosteroid isomerase-like protein
MDASTIRHFLHAQVQAWNAGDKQAFFDAYKSVSTGGLQIEYVGRGPASDGWPVLEGMWSQQSAKIEIEEVELIVNGNEAACHNRNKLRGTTMAIETMELYRFDDAGSLLVRYFIKQP